MRKGPSRSISFVDTKSQAVPFMVDTSDPERAARQG